MEFEAFQKLLLASVNNNVLDCYKLIDLPLDEVIPIVDVFYGVKLEENKALNSDSKGENISVDLLASMGFNREKLEKYS